MSVVREWSYQDAIAQKGGSISSDGKEISYKDLGKLLGDNYPGLVKKEGDKVYVNPYGIPIRVVDYSYEIKDLS